MTSISCIPIFVIPVKRQNLWLGELEVCPENQVVYSHFSSLDLSPTPSSGSDLGEVLEISGRIVWVKDGPYHV